MAYSKKSLIESEDFNAFVGPAVTSTANTLNAVWGTGNGNRGYGQTPVTSVADGELVEYTDWAALVTVTSTAAQHQGTSITSVTPPTQYQRIDYSYAIPTNLGTIYESRNNAAAQGTTSTTTTTSSSGWVRELTFIHTISFESGDKARYFFNCGGQLALTFSHPDGSGVNNMFYRLAGNCGTLVLSSPSSGGVLIAGTTYTGVTKIGGSGAPSSISPNSGYWGLTTNDTIIFKQFASTSTTGYTPTGYLNSSIEVRARVSSPAGANGDNGSTITLTTIWTESPSGLLANSSTVNCIVRPPSQGFLTKSWGTVSVTGAVSGN